MRIILDIPLTIKEVSWATGGAVSGYLGSESISAISTDTRELIPGDLFIALCGERYDGNDFCDAAAGMGAFVLCERDFSPAITVKSTADALLRLAKYYKTLLPHLFCTLGITGSCGKTTTKEFLRKMCERKYTVHATEGNHNNTVGLPITILSAKRQTEILICELGTNNKGEIKKLSECLMPDVGIITNIGSAHIGRFGSREAIAKEKSEIASSGCSYVICKGDEPLLFNIKNRVPAFVDTDGDFSLTTKQIEINSSVIDLNIMGKTIEDVKTPINAKHLLEALIYSVAFCSLIGFSDEEIVNAISDIKPEDMRHKLIKVSNFYILDDSYNASYESILAAFEQLKLYNNAKSALIGDVLELGDKSETIHENIGKAAARTGLKNLYLYGENALTVKRGATKAGMPENKIFVNSGVGNTALTTAQILENKEDDEIILFKASHRLNLKKIINELKEKAND